MENQPKKMAIIASKGTLDMAYPPLILATTAAALGYEVKIFFTFYGLQLLRKRPGPHQDQPARQSGDADADADAGHGVALPGMESMATMMMKQKIKKHGVASLEELRALCLEADVTLIACQMTIDLFEFDKSEFISGIEYGGAATFLEFAGQADITLFI